MTTRRDCTRVTGLTLRAAVVGVATVLVAGCASSTTSSQPDPGPSATPAPFASPTGEPGRLVGIGHGRKMFLECNGSGGPTVLLVSGLGGAADDWQITERPQDANLAVYKQAARGTRVCAYDRPGTESSSASGTATLRSTPVPQPTTGTAAADDLAAMLAASGEPGPYVLVGHSYGGAVIRLYAAAHPGSVAGLVFVDALSEDVATRLTPAQLIDVEELNTPSGPDVPADAESISFGGVFQELRAIRSEPTVPTVVLSADRSDLTAAQIASGKLPPFVTQSFADALWSAQLSSQDALAARFPGSRHITRTHSTHYIQLFQPELVDDAIAGIVSRVRSTPRPSGRPAA